MQRCSRSNLSLTKSAAKDANQLQTQGGQVCRCTANLYLSSVMTIRSTHRQLEV